ncbi:MAG: GNAT family N-acetyltransferase [Gemmataceae bacterium]|nr:GNAT family N-acetyltransferase [Gemmataceae bacterium]
MLVADRDETRVLRTLADAEALVPEWEALLARSSCDVPFLSPQWLLPWWSVFGHLDGREPAILRFDEGGRLVGLALLCFRWHRYRPGIPFRRVEVWGAGEAEADGICSDYLNVIAETGKETEVAARFAEALRRWPGRWHELVVPLVDAAHPMPIALVEAFRSRGFGATLDKTTTAGYVPFPATWEAYLAKLDKKDRYLVKRSEKDFDEWAAGTGRLRIASTVSEIEEGSAILRRLHGERWEGGGTFRSPRFLAFHDEAMRSLLAAGGLRLAWLEAHGEPVAAMYSASRGGKVAFYQCGRKLDVPKNLRPGGVLLYREMRRALEDGEREFDFLGGEATYKRQLALAERSLATLRVVRPGWREQARLWVEWGKKWWRGKPKAQEPT